MYLSLNPKYKNTISLVFIIIFCLGNFIWKSNIYAERLTSFNQFFDYLAVSFNSFGGLVKNIFDVYRSYKVLKREIGVLRDELKKNRNLNWKITELTNENKRLRQILSLKPKSKYEIIQAEVISSKPDNWFKTIIIDKGSNEGLQNYMPVIANQVVSTQVGEKDQRHERIVEGLVGKIVHVNRNSSRVLLINNSYSRLGGVIKRTGHWALLEGQSPSNDTPLLRYISLKAEIKEGDEIITSGNQGIFPKGISIGRIVGVPERHNTFQEVRVKPFLNFQKLDYVYVIRKEKDIVLEEGGKDITPEKGGKKMIPEKKGKDITLEEEN